MLEWQWSAFPSLSLDEFYQIAKARQGVFINEQKCFYPDLDDLDPYAWHLSAWKSQSTSPSKKVTDKKLSAYLRVLEPNVTCDEPVLGRLLVIKEERGSGLAKSIMKIALENIQATYPDTAIRTAAQLYLQHFYENFGFKAISQAYNEDGIMHIDMLRL